MNQEMEQSMGSFTAATVDDPQISVDEVDMWLEMFAEGKGDSEG